LFKVFFCTIFIFIFILWFKFVNFGSVLCSPLIFVLWSIMRLIFCLRIVLKLQNMLDILVIYIFCMKWWDHQKLPNKFQNSMILLHMTCPKHSLSIKSSLEWSSIAGNNLFTQFQHVQDSNSYINHIKNVLKSIFKSTK